MASFEIVPASYKIIHPERLATALEDIEYAARISHKSERKEDWTPEDTKNFVKKWVIGSGHWACGEFGPDLTVEFVFDIGAGREALRHRHISPLQQSTRYVNYGKKGATVIKPAPQYLPNNSYQIWFDTIEHSIVGYNKLLNEGVKPEFARSVLPLALTAPAIIKANLREWHQIFLMRTSTAAHPQIRDVMIPLLEEVKKLVPIVFDDVEPNTSETINNRKTR
jgi:thymidylate synthase (FAD)